MCSKILFLYVKSSKAFLDDFIIVFDVCVCDVVVFKVIEKVSVIEEVLV